MHTSPLFRTKDLVIGTSVELTGGNSVPNDIDPLFSLVLTNIQLHQKLTCDLPLFLVKKISRPAFPLAADNSIYDRVEA